MMFVMVRRDEVLLRHVDKSGRGIEIGPSYNPVAPKSEGYRVHVIDHMDREHLVAKYAGDPAVDVGRIEDVDFVWSGRSFVELTGTPKDYDWIVASHVIEHSPDLVGFLNDCDSILKDDGVLALAVPDKRRCFDYYRPISGLGGVIDSHIRHDTVHSAGSLAEQVLYEARSDGASSWGLYRGGVRELANTTERATKAMGQVPETGEYADCHAWCFTPHSFRLLISDLHSMGLIALREVDFYATDGNEFLISLSRSGQGPMKSRLELLDMVDVELAQAASQSRRRPLMLLARRVSNRLKRMAPGNR